MGDAVNLTNRLCSWCRLHENRDDSHTWLHLVKLGSTWRYLCGRGKCANRLLAYYAASEALAQISLRRTNRER